MSIAEDIAARFNNDGQNWETHSGAEFHKVASAAATWIVQYDTATRSLGATLWRFADGSMLVACESYWDILERVEGLTQRAADMLGDGSPAAAVVATWVDGGDEAWALEDIDGDLMAPTNGDWI